MKKIKLVTSLTVVVLGILFSGCKKDALAPSTANPNGIRSENNVALVAEPINLGLAGDFAILAKSGITTTGVTTILEILVLVQSPLLR